MYARDRPCFRGTHRERDTRMKGTKRLLPRLDTPEDLRAWRNVISRAALHGLLSFGVSQLSLRSRQQDRFDANAMLQRMKKRTASEGT